MFYIFSQCLFNKYCLKTYCGPGIVTLSAEDTLIKKKINNSALMDYTQ